MGKNGIARMRRAAVWIGICAVLSGRALASDTLIPVGETVGIRLEVDGVLVAGTGPVETENGPCAPAAEAGIRAGDVITAVNGEAVEHAEELAALLGELDGADGAELTLSRDGRPMSVTVVPALEPEAGPRLGLWLRDGVSGIGTVTYIDPETGEFGALGHGVNDPESGALLPASDGGVSPAQVVDVTPGRPGSPGELTGSFPAAETGVIRKNTDCGIFGQAQPAAFGQHEPVPVASPDEVENGEAVILACIAGRETREYRVEIARAGFMNGGGRDLTVRVTDPELLAVTGGIVQGMSGSPILQNGKLVGAVTHVLTADPTRGYGILAVNMLKAAA